MVRIVAAYIVGDEAIRIRLSLQSILKWIDKVYIILSPYETETIQEILSFNDERIEIILRNFENEHIGANGRQRNKYLEVLKEKELGSWCLVLDADEVVDDNGFRFKDFLANTPYDCYNPRMRHLIRTLGWEDATQEKHYVPCRLFKVNEDLFYDEVEHPILKGWNNHGGNVDGVTLWHLSSMYDVFYEHKKYLNHKKKSNIHTPEFLDQWIRTHLMGRYPMRPVKEEELPMTIRRYFGV